VLQVQLIERRLDKDPSRIPPVLEAMRSTLGHGLIVAERRRGGRVDVQSAPGAGARFRLWFPAAASGG
jgi:signal transduction histidine kinase